MRAELLDADVGAQQIAPAELASTRWPRRRDRRAVADVDPQPMARTAAVVRQCSRRWRGRGLVDVEDRDRHARLGEDACPSPRPAPNRPR